MKFQVRGIFMFNKPDNRIASFRYDVEVPVNTGYREVCQWVRLNQGKIYDYLNENVEGTDITISIQQLWCIGEGEDKEWFPCISLI